MKKKKAPQNQTGNSPIRMVKKKETSKPDSAKATRLSRERIIEAALNQADRDGIQALSMRKLAGSLGVEAMSLYHHVSSREALLDLLVDRVFEELSLPETKKKQNWKQWMTQLSIRMRDVLLRHPWAVGLLDSRRNPGPGTLYYQDSRLGGFLGAGFPLDLAAHAIAIQDSFVYGFVIQELALPFENGELDPNDLEGFTNSIEQGTYPNLQEMAEKIVFKKGYSFRREFDFGLNLIIEGLAARFDTSH